MDIFPIIPHDNLPGFVANEHIDWTNATDENLVTSTGHVKASRFVIRDFGTPAYYLWLWTVNTGITADRHLYFDVGNTNRVLTLSGDPTLADWFDQSVKTTADIVGNSFITGGDIGVAADTDLMQLANGALTVNGTLGAGAITGETLTLLKDFASTDSIEEMMRITRTTSGMAAIGLGLSQEYYLEDDGGNSLQAARIVVAWDDLEDDADEGSIAFYTREVETVAERMKIGSELIETSIAMTIGASLEVDTYFIVNTTDFVVSNHIVEIGSADGSDKIQIYHDNTRAYFKTTDGEFRFQTDEGTNTHTFLTVRGKGTGDGYIYCYDGSGGGSRFAMKCANNYGEIYVDGTPIAFLIQSDAEVPVRLFFDSGEGETQQLQIYGRREGDVARNINIGISPDADDTALFSNVGTIDFDTNVNVLTGNVYKLNAVQVVGAQGAAIADATDADDVILRLNDLLARVRAHGLIAT